MEEGSFDGEAGPRTRRLCAAVSGAGPGLLASALSPGEFDRFYLAGGSAGEVAVAPAGIDEIHLVRDLVAAVRLRLAGSLREGPEPAAPVFLALSVGMVRIVGDGFGGPGLRKAQALAGHPAVREAVLGGAPPAAGLAVVVSDALYDDLRAEGLISARRSSWRPVPVAAAWLCRAETAGL